jgi:phosphoglycolate phosphatase-like HAD superfamily hydrolase
MPPPLPSWNEGATRTAILDFVTRVTTPGTADFVAPSERIATFDNDGTLWCEQPLQVQAFFTLQRLHALAAADPAMRTRQPFKAYLEQDLEAIRGLGKKGILEVGATTHAGMSEEQFAGIARAWLDTATHPKLGSRFIELTYAPQIELLDYLSSHGFTTFIVSGGGVDFIRAFAQGSYGIPPERVVGSSFKTQFSVRAEGVGLTKLPELNSFDDREAKVVNIGLHIGRRPLLACGNSDGDLAMLRYTLSGPGARLALLLHHDDAAREFAYDRDFKLSPLADALDNSAQYGIRVVSMRRDWSRVFR